MKTVWSCSLEYFVAIGVFSSFIIELSSKFKILELRKLLIKFLIVVMSLE